jgi:diguanylate cyclase (GGDEF)-like protein
MDIATPPSADDRQRKLQQHRLRMTRLSVVSTALEAGIVALFAWAGEVSWSVAGFFLLLGVALPAGFAFVIWRGWNLRLQEPGLLKPQIAASIAIQLVLLVAAPKLWPLCLAAVLVTYLFAMMSFSVRQFNVAWWLVGAAMGGALYAARGRFEHLGSSDLTIAILWLFFFLCLRQLSTIGAQFNALRTQLSEKNRQLSESLARIQQLASHDDLTGVLNRRAFMQQLADERLRAQRRNEPFCVAMLDIDNFKAVNDRFGHLAGDTVLKEFCRIVASCLRATDRFARYGGEEFAVLLVPLTTAEPALAAMERLRAAVEAQDWGTIGNGLAVTVSIGVAMFDRDEAVEQQLARADAALYAAKHRGRNRVVAG